MAQARMSSEWAQLTEEILTGMYEWRQQHPEATFREIETAVQERVQGLAAKMVEDLAMESQLAEWTQQEQRPSCPDCQKPLASRGSRERKLKGPGNREIRIQRHYGVCPQCERGFFPPG